MKILQIKGKHEKKQNKTQANPAVNSGLFCIGTLRGAVCKATVTDVSHMTQRSARQRGAVCKGTVTNVVH